MDKKRKYDPFASIIERAKGSTAKIVLPEGHDPRILEAANWAAENNLCKIILLGDKNLLASKIRRKAQKNITIIDPKSSGKTREMYAYSLFQLRKDKGMTEEKAMEALKDNLTFAMMMLKSEDADGIVAGAVRETADVLRGAFSIIKARPKISKVSSVMLIEVPEGNKIGENGILVFGDCAVNINPTDEELADTAILSAETAKTICNMRPNVALLGFTTKSHEDVDDEQTQKIKRAYKIVRRKDPMLRIDGELQGDAALSPLVAASKCRDSDVEGKANVLIFPDIMSGNIGYKLAQRVANTRAIGPILQGLNKPVNDLSRGTTAEEIIYNIAITVLQSKNTIKGS
ncbi:MAG: phosphate acetyltransferase [Clostridia bacterium]|nr:phosphate acetyltransferase [Clostridia bacterium]